MVDAVHDDIGTVLKVNALGSQDPWNRNLLRIHGIQLKRLHTADQRFGFARFTVEDGVEDIHQEGILVIVGNHHVVAVLEILFDCPRRRLQRGNDLSVIRSSVIECLLILKYDQEAPRDCLS